MKRKAGIYVLLVFAVVVLAACGADPVEIQSKYVAMMEKPASEKQIKKVEAYLDENLPAMEGAAADEMLIEYETYIYPFYNGAVDYGRIIERYGSYASNAYEKLCGLKKEEQANPATKDGSFAIGRQELCARANRLELFLKGAKKSSQALVQDAEPLYKSYVKLILEGAADSPNFDLKKGDFLQEAKTAYEDFIRTNPDTVLAGVLTEYLDYVEQIGGRLDLGNTGSGKEYYSTCSYLESEAGKRVME